MAVDWTRGMARTWRYMEVDPATWREVRQLRSVVGCSVTRDLSADVMESASLTMDGPDAGERYVRVWLDAEQGGESESVCAGTFLCQTPTWRLGGGRRELEVSAYGSLIELADAMPPLGYTVAAGADCALAAADVCGQACRAPVLASACGRALADDVVAGTDDTWLDLARAVAAAGGCDVRPDVFGRVCVVPSARTSALAPVRTFRDDATSVLLPEVSHSHDWYGLPNVVEVVWSEGSRCLTATARNDDPASPLSVASRGREVTRRVENPEGLRSGCTQTEVDDAAARLLAELSALERTVEFSHGFVPGVGLGDCVRVECGGVSCVAVVARQEWACDPAATVRCEATFSDGMGVVA